MFPFVSVLLLALLMVAAPAAAQDPEPGSEGDAAADESATDGDTADGDAGTGDEETGEGDTDDGDSDAEPAPEPLTYAELQAANASLQEQVAALRQELAGLQKTEKPDEPSKPETKVKAGIKLSTIITIGNSDTVTLDGAFNWAIENVYEFEFSNSIAYQYIARDGDTEQNKLMHVIGFDYLPEDTFSPFVFVSQGFEEKRKVTYVINAGLGLKYTPFRDPWDPIEYGKEGRFKYSVSLAVLVDHQQFQPNANTDHQTFIRLSLWLKGEQKLADGLFIKNKFEFVPAVEDFTNWDLNNTLSIDIVIEERYTIDFSWSYREDSTPAASVRRVDQEFKVGINVKIK